MITVSHKTIFFFVFFIPPFSFGFTEMGRRKTKLSSSHPEQMLVAAHTFSFCAAHDVQSNVLDLCFVYAPVILFRIFLIKFCAYYLLVHLSYAVTVYEPAPFVSRLFVFMQPHSYKDWLLLVLFLFCEGDCRCGKRPPCIVAYGTSLEEVL